MDLDAAKRALVEGPVRLNVFRNYLCLMLLLNCYPSRRAIRTEVSVEIRNDNLKCDIRLLDRW